MIKTRKAILIFGSLMQTEFFIKSALIKTKIVLYLPAVIFVDTLEVLVTSKCKNWRGYEFVKIGESQWCVQSENIMIRDKTESTRYLRLSFFLSRTIECPILLILWFCCSTISPILHVLQITGVSLYWRKSPIPRIFCIVSDHTIEPIRNQQKVELSYQEGSLLVFFARLTGVPAFSFSTTSSVLS